MKSARFVRGRGRWCNLVRVGTVRSGSTNQIFKCTCLWHIRYPGMRVVSVFLYFSVFFCILNFVCIFLYSYKISVFFCISDIFSPKKVNVFLMETNKNPSFWCILDA